MKQTLSSILLAAGAALTAGCAFMNPAAIPTGTTTAELTQRLGPPTGEYRLPAGGKRLEYARGPMGKQTWMFDFDGAGRLAKTTQVLTEAQFNAIRPGMTREEVLSVIGHPGETSRLAWQRQTVWSYRYETPFCQWFQLGLDTSGKVTDSGYYPDPFCMDNADDRTL